jgi:hypothetical protein
MGGEVLSREATSREETVNGDESGCMIIVPHAFFPPRGPQIFRVMVDTPHSFHSLRKQQPHIIHLLFKMAVKQCPLRTNENSLDCITREPRIL